MKRLIAEFEQQSFTQIIFPHMQTDWNDYLDEAMDNFQNIIEQIIKYQKCLVVCDDIKRVKKRFKKHENLFFVKYKTDDTWARDSSAISIKNANNTELLDFIFNGWGNKFKAKKDNAMSKNIKKHYKTKVKKCNFILEGGGIESNGDGVLLTTSTCMLNKNRNKKLNKKQITKKLSKYFDATKVLYLNHGYLAGDDTDSHIDTLARFIDKKTIVYVKCKDKKDEHYKELKLMENELKNYAKKYGFKLIAVPMTDAIYYEKERLPATYANFLFVNSAILVPTYGVPQDKKALNIFKKHIKNRDIIGIDCSTLIRQHGSLHCVTMNFAKGIKII